MTVIRPNSVSGITSITAQANEINFFRSNGALAGLQLNGVNFNTTTGVSTFNNLDVGGVLTYQDVTNVDSVGIITARSTIDAQGSINLADSIIHSGDTNTKFGFPAADTITAETAGSERLRITSDGLVGIGTIPASGTTLDIDASGGGVLALRRNSVNTNNKISLSHDGTNGTLESTNAVIFRAGGSERLRITSDGKMGLGTNSPNTKLDVVSSPINATTVNTTTCKQLGLWINPAGTGDNTTGNIYNGIALSDGFAGLYGYDAGASAATGLGFFTGNASAVAERLRITSDGNITINENLAVGGSHPWSVTGGNYGNLSISGGDANSSGFLNLGNGAAASNADFDLARIKIHNGATEVARITGTTATGDSGDANIKFFTKKAGSGLKEILRIRNDGFVETMYSENTGSYSLSASPTPRLRIRNDYGGDGIISSAQFFAKRGSGAASIFDIGVITTSTDYESNLIISSRNTDATYSEKLRIESEGQIRMNYGNNAKQAYALRSTFRTITGHSSTGFQYVRCALLAARTAYRVCINTTGGNYGPGAQFFTVLRNWDNTTLYVSDKFNMGSAYANAVRMQSDNGGGNWYMEISINLTTTSQGFGLSVIPIGNNAGTMTTNLQYYGSGMSNLSYTSSAQSL